MGLRKWKVSKGNKVIRVLYSDQYNSVFIKTLLCLSQEKKLSYMHTRTLYFIISFLVSNGDYVVMSSFSLLMILEVAIIKFVFERIGP